MGVEISPGVSEDGVIDLCQQHLSGSSKSEYDGMETATGTQFQDAFS
jgi:hypothetical protein